MKLNFVVKVHFVIFISFLFPAISISQNIYNGFLKEFYLDRQPSAKAIEMGRGLVAYPEYEFSSWYNPATIGLSEPVTVNCSYLSPDYSIDGKEYFLDYNASFNSRRYGAIGFSLNSMELKIINIIPEDPRISWRYKLYNLNYAYQPVKDFYAGINFDILSIDYYESYGYNKTYSQNLYPVDIGVLKIFRVPETNHIVHKITVGSSLYNVTNVKFNDLSNNKTEPLPVILRFGASYNFQYFLTGKPQEEKIINFLGYLEYENLLNSGLFTTYKAGSEIELIDLVSFRLGYFSRKLYEQSGKYSSSEQHQITYGVGLKIPISKLSEGFVPLKVQIEYSPIPQPSFEYYDSMYDLNTFSLSIRWEKPFVNF
jgi:hypothetical protein